MDSETKVVLVVEDEEPIRELVSAILEGEGYAVLTAANGIEAMAIALESSVDLVVSDIMMAGMDGHELSQALHQYTDLPVVLMSAHQAWTLPTAPLADAQAFLRKPFTVDQILGTVRDLLSPPPVAVAVTWG